MVQYWKSLRRKYFDIKTKGVSLVLLNVMIALASISALISGVLSLYTDMPLLQITPVLVCIAISGYAFYIANHRGKLDLAVDVLIVSVCFIAFPVLFFLNGGVESGMSCWFALGVIFIFLLSRGAHFIILLVLDVIIISGCYLVAYFFPKTVIHPFDTAGVFFDEFQGILTTTVAIGIIVKLQVRLYQGQVELTMKKSAELLEATNHAHRARREAEIANKAKSNFLANMSHEIRTPINTVLGMNEIILRESREKETVELAKDIRTSTESLLGIVNEILDLSRIEAGKMELMMDRYELSAMLRETAVMFAIRAKEKGVIFDMEISPDLPAVLYGDELRIRQVLNNLLSNAVKYTNEGGVTMVVRGESDGTYANLHFEVIDTGIGIKEQDLDKLFAAFERIDEKQNRNIEGTGLGMSIAWSFLEMMGTTLEVKTQYGVGSTFFFDLTQKIIDPTPMGEFDISERMGPDMKETRRVLHAPDWRVLVVDDNAMNRKVFRKLLEETEVCIDEADNGYSCLELIKQNKYDIIFLDHMMPEIDGVETFMYMKGMQEHLCKDTPVVILTANAIAGAKEEYEEIGFDAYIPKPIDPDMLVNIMETLAEKTGKSFSHKEIAYAIERPKDQQEITLPQLSGFDWEYAMKHVTSEKMLKDSLADFYQMAPSLQKEFDELFLSVETEEGRKNYGIKAHSMKSNLALLGCLQPSALAKMLELAAKGNQIKKIQDLHPYFMEELAEVVAALETMFGQKENKPLMEDVEWIKGMLSMLQVALENFDYDSADRVMELLDGYGYEKELQGKVDFWKQQTTQLNREAVLEGLKEYL